MGEEFTDYCRGSPFANAQNDEEKNFSLISKDAIHIYFHIIFCLVKTKTCFVCCMTSILGKVFFGDSVEVEM